MWPRYYLISAIAVLALTIVISRVRQTTTKKEFIIIFISVAGGFVILMGLLVLLSQILVLLGIAKTGFVMPISNLRVGSSCKLIEKDSEVDLPSKLKDPQRAWYEKK